MKRNLYVALTGLNRQPMLQVEDDLTKDGNQQLDEAGKVKTKVSQIYLSVLCANALLNAESTVNASQDNEKQQTEKLARARLAQRINDAGETDVDLSFEDCMLIKKHISLVFSPLVMMRVTDILEG